MENRRTFIKKSALAAGMLTLPNAAFLQNLLEIVPGKMQALRHNVGIYTESGGTIGWYIGKNGIAVVDTQFPQQAAHLLEEIRKQSGQPIDILFNTHHHADHTGGNIAFKGLVNKVVAHVHSKTNQEAVAIARKTEAQQLYPDTTFEKTWTTRLDEETITTHYFGPAHTNGDSVVHFEHANVAHIGDLVFNRRFPYIDKTAGASISHWIEVLAKIEKTFDKDTLFVFGHAGDTYPVQGSHKELAAMQNYLDKLLLYVRKAIKNGVEEKALIESTKIIPGAEEWTGAGVERSITAAYLELKKP